MKVGNYLYIATLLLASVTLTGSLDVDLWGAAAIGWLAGGIIVSYWKLVR